MISTFIILFTCLVLGHVATLENFKELPNMWVQDYQK